ALEAELARLEPAELLVPDAAQMARQLRLLEQRLVTVERRKLQTLDQRVDQLFARLQAQRPQARLARDRDRLTNLHRRLQAALSAGSTRRERRLEQLLARLLAQHPRHRLALLHRRLDELDPRLRRAIARTLERKRLTLAQVARALHAVSPLATLERGYAIAFDARGKVLRSPAHVEPGDALRIRLAEGELTARAGD
ncbi:MAG: exodeoxyribonuclease VII large subunit, partial [Lysobacterales bacterium 13-68-4]